MSGKTSRTLLWKVLKANISLLQITGYALAMAAGLTVVMLAAVLYADGMRLANPDDGDRLFPDNLRILSKKGASSPLSFLGQPQGFQTDEVKRLSEQPWVTRCAPFETSDFDASVTAEFGSTRFSTALFFEAVPDEFFDAIPAGWEFDPDAPEVPIILPADYLAMYNFGFAPARGLPRLSERMVTKIPLQVHISGENGTATLPGRVAGFSSLNTIAVPPAFLRWANDRYGSDIPTSPSRLAVVTSGNADSEAASYFKANRIEAADSRDGNGRLAALLRGATAVVAIIGAAFCLLALFIMTLSLRLLVRKNMEAIRQSRLLGFPAADVAAGYIRMIIAANLAALSAACAATAAVTGIWHRVMASVGCVPAPFYTSMLPGLALMLAISAVAALAIRRMIGSVGTN